MDILTRGLFFTARSEDLVPDPVVFAPKAGVNINAYIVSNPVTITGITSPIPVELSDGEYSINSGPWLPSKSQKVVDGNVVTLRIKSSATYNTATHMNVKLGPLNVGWTVTTRIPNIQPTPFFFTDQSNVDLNAEISSGTIDVGGLEPDFDIIVRATNGFIDAGTDRLSGTKQKTMTVRTSPTGSLVVACYLQSSSEFGASKTTIVTVGAGLDNWVVTTRSPNVSPIPFVVPSVIVDPSFNWVYGPIEVAGIEPNYKISIDQTNVEFDAASSPALLLGAYKSSLTEVQTSADGKLYVKVRVLSSPAYDTPKPCSLTIGSTTANWVVKTRLSDLTPNTFTIPDIVGAELNTQSTSIPVTITGLDPGVPIVVSTTLGAVDAGPDNLTTFFAPTQNTTTSNNGTLKVAVRATSSPVPSTTSTAVVTVGTGSSRWNVSTRAPKMAPDTFNFADILDAERSTEYTSAIVTVSGLDANTTYNATCESGAISVGTTSVSGTYTDLATVVTSDTGSFVMRARLTSSTQWEFDTSMRVHVGTVDDTWYVRTRKLKDIPLPYAFTDVVNAEVSTSITSQTILVSGLEPNYPFAVQATGGLVDAGTGTLSGTFSSSKVVTTSSTGALVVAARITSGAGELSTSIVTVTIGAGTTNWTIKTKAYDITPDPQSFKFTDVVDAPLNMMQKAETITVTGLQKNHQFVVTATGGIVDAGTTGLTGNSSATKTVTTSDTGTFVMTAYVTTSRQHGVPSPATVTVGSSTITWTVTTMQSGVSVATTEKLFGEPVAIAGTVAIVGAYLDDTRAYDSGIAYVYGESTPKGDWVQKATLVPTDLSANDYFGVSVDIDAGTAIVGAYGSDFTGGDSGSAYIFTDTGTTWIQKAKLVNDLGTTDALFGGSVGISGDNIIIAAIGENALYSYKRSMSDWSFNQRFTSPDAVPGTFLGSALQVNSEYLVVGAPMPVAGQANGSVAIFKNDGVEWVFKSTIQSPVSVGGGARFGRSISFVSATRVAIGSPGVGAVYLYDITGTTPVLVKTFDKFNNTSVSDFGRSVAINDNYLVVGASSEVNPIAGHTYVYYYKPEISDWVQVGEMANAGTSTSKHYGTSVGITSSNMIVVGGQIGSIVLPAPKEIVFNDF